MAYAIIDGRSSMSNLSKAQSLTSCHVVVIQANVIFGHVTMMTVYCLVFSVYYHQSNLLSCTLILLDMVCWFVLTVSPRVS